MPGAFQKSLRLLAVAGFGLLAATFSACRQSTTPKEEIDGVGWQVTFNHDIGPIVFEKCAACHRPGESAPFSLLTYEDVRHRASQIAEVTRKRFMPPWLPKEGHGEFIGARRLTDREIQTLNAWAQAGAPRGDEADLADPPTFVDGWQLGPPDLVLESPLYTLAAQTGNVFRNFVVPIELDAPRWVQSIELRPINPRVTHHARLGVDESYESIRRDAADEQPGYAGMAWGQDPDGQLVTWTPGMLARRGTPGTAWRLHPKTCLVLHTHMQPSGKTETVQFRIGIHFAAEPPSRQPVMLRIGSRDIDIPAGEPHQVVEDEYTLPVDLDVHSIFPHAHSLCREVRVEAVLPDGSRQPLIWIEHFDENWHDDYRYVRPMRLPRGSKLMTRFVYDNTDGNVRNRHHPPQRVVYGSNADDEMADVYLQVTAVHADQRAVLLEDYTREEQRSKLVGYRKTLAAYPQDPWSREGLAACYIALGKPSAAIQALEERLKLGPTEVHSVAALGMACFAGGQFARAEDHERQALTLDPDYPLAWLGLGKALAAQKKTEDAGQAFRRALELAPGLTDAQLNLADILLHQGQLDEAALACTAASEISPDAANAYLKLAEIRAKQGRYDDSLQHLETACRLAPYTHPPKVLLAVYCFGSGEAERARTLLHEAYKELPDHPVPALFLGQFARREQQADVARQYLAAAACKAVPDNWPASHKQRFGVLLHSERFQLAQQLGDAELARDAIDQWLRCEPDNQQLRKLRDRFRSDEGR